MTVYDVIVVGMGSAGCMASATLQHLGKKVLGLEAMDRLGGRIHTAAFGDGIVELGAEWIHGTENNNVYSYAISGGIDLQPQELEHRVYMSDGLDGDAILLKELMEYAFSVVNQPPEEPQPLGEHISKRVREYIEKTHSDLDEKYIETFLRWMNLMIGTHEACEDWDDVSTQTSYKELDGHPQMSWHKHGYKTFLDLMMNRYDKGSKPLEIKLNTEVVRIILPQEPSDPVEVICSSDDYNVGDKYRARAVIVTLSVGVLKDRQGSLFHPPLPATKVNAINDIAIGTVNKVVLLFETIWWPTDSSFFSFLWRDEDIAEVDEDDEWITNIFGASRSMANEKCLVFWLSGRDAIFIEQLSDEKVRSKVMELLNKFMGINHVIPEPIDIIRSSWNKNRYTRGSYSYDSTSTPNRTTARIDLAEPIFAHDKLCLMFAGEATHKTYFSTVHGAVSSGMREAVRFMASETADHWPENQYFKWMDCNMICDNGPFD